MSSSLFQADSSDILTYITETSQLLTGIPFPCNSCREKLSRLEKTIDYTFSDIRLLSTAVTHSSYVNENPDQGLHDYERLEFLGDAVLSLALSHYLFTRFQDKSEGDLTLMRSWLGSETLLAEVASDLHLGEYILLGAGENSSGGRTRPTLLEDVCEALFGAVYLDGGFHAAHTLIVTLFGYRLDAAADEKDVLTAKNTLQAWTHSRFGVSPEYSLLEWHGPDHNRTYTVEVRCTTSILGTGTGSSKKEAEMNAAHDALISLQQES